MIANDSHETSAPPSRLPSTADLDAVAAEEAIRHSTLHIAFHSDCSACRERLCEEGVLL